IVLDRGRIQQIGTPSEIYHAPANVFVAGFVGNPRMNLAEGTIGTDLTFTATDCRFDLRRLDAELRPYAGQTLTVGIRPEDLRVAETEAGAISGAVDVIEDLGAEKFLHVRTKASDWVARVAPAERFQPGDVVNLAASVERLHLFSRGTRVG